MVEVDGEIKVAHIGDFRRNLPVKCRRAHKKVSGGECGINLINFIYNKKFKYYYVNYIIKLITFHLS